MIEKALKPFLDCNCTIQLYSDSTHAPIFGCRLSIECERLVITPQVLFDELEDQLLLSNLQAIEHDNTDMITLELKKHPLLKSITILKEKQTPY